MKKVVLVSNLSHASERSKILGARAWALAHADWEIEEVSFNDPERLAPLLRHWHPDGILYFSYVPRDGLVFQGPAVVVHWRTEPRDWLPNASFVACETDRTAQTVVSELLTHGFRRFVYSEVTDEHGLWSAWRRRNLARALRAAGFRLERAPTATAPNRLEQGRARLAAYLTDLSPDTVVLASNDTWGASLLELCARHGLVVPAHFSVVGFDNTVQRCESVRPFLASFDLRFDEAGALGARLLDERMAGLPQAQNPGAVAYPPPPVLVERASVRHTICSMEPRVARALDFLHRHAADPIGVEDIAAVLGVSRRQAGTLFRRQLGQSVLEILTGARIALVQQRLRDTDDSIHAVCATLPFLNEIYLKSLFRTRCGLSMRDYRKTQRTATARRV